MQKQAKILLILSIFVISAPHSLEAITTDWQAYQRHGHRSSKWNTLVKSGFEAFESGNWQGATNFFERAKTKGCKDGLVIFKLAQYSEYLRDYRKAVKLFSQANKSLKKHYPKHTYSFQIHEHLGKIYYDQNQYGKALPHLEYAIKKLGPNFLRLMMIGQVYRMDQKLTQATSYFEQALKYPPPKEIAAGAGILVMLELVKAYYQLDNLKFSLYYANQVLKLDPSSNTAKAYKQKIESEKIQQEQRRMFEHIIK